MPRYTLTHVCKGVNLDQYTKQEVFYAIHNLKQAGYVDAYVEFAGDTLMQCVVSDITYNGHMFLKSVRDNKAWGKIKSAVKQVGGVSLPVLLEIAKDIALHSLGIGG